MECHGRLPGGRNIAVHRCKIVCQGWYIQGDRRVNSVGEHGDDVSVQTQDRELGRMTRPVFFSVPLKTMTLL